MPVPMVTLSDVDQLERIAFFGSMCSGKSYMAKYLSTNYKYLRIGFADKLKQVAEDLFWLKGSKDGTSRKLLQEFADDIKKWDPDLFIKHFLISAEWLVESRIVCDDLRFVREAEVLKENGFTLIKVVCDENVRQGRINVLYPNTLSSAHEHVSEQDHYKITPDYIINSTIDTDVRELNRLLWVLE